MRKKQIDSILDKQLKKSRKSIDIEKYCGIIKLKKDPLSIQTELRDEWK